MRPLLRRLTLGWPCLWLACGGGGAEAPTVLPSVSGAVFYDENGNGLQDPGEDVRIPGVLVSLGGRTTVSGASGAFSFASVPAAAGQLDAPEGGLPPFFTASPVMLDAGRGSTLSLPLRLPIAANRPNVFLALGDSITAGQGSESGRGFVTPLAERLAGHWGRGTVVGDGRGGELSAEGRDRLASRLRDTRPAYLLIEYGTNDYSRECRRLGECDTLANLRAMVREARANSTLPVVATVLPGNPPALPDLLDEVRHRWVVETNAGIRQLAREEGAVLADTYSAFVAEPDSRRLFADYLHPNDRGYLVVADTFFKAITQPRASSSP